MRAPAITRCGIAALFLGSANIAVAQEPLLDSFGSAGTRAMSMGGAFTGLSDEFAGLFSNPAGLARMKRGQTTLEIANSQLTNDTRFFGTPAHVRVARMPLGGAGVAYPFPVVRGSFVVAAGWARTQSVETALRIEGYDESAGFEKEGFSEDLGSVGAFALGGAADIAPNLAVGVTLMRLKGDNQFRQELTQIDSRDVHPDVVSTYERYGSDDQIRAWGMRAGVHYAHPSGLRFGMSVRSPITYDISSRLEDEFEDVYTDGTDTYPVTRYTDAYAVRSPLEFALGCVVVRRGLTISGDIVYSDLQQARYETQPSAVEPNVEDFRSQYRNTFRFHVGLEYRFASWPIALRGGFYQDPVRYVGGGSQPEIRVERDRRFWSAGVGTVLEKALSLDAAVRVGGYAASEGRREDDVRLVTVRLAVTYAWGEP